MFLFEMKKMMNRKTWLLFFAIYIVSSVVLFVQMKGVSNASNTKILQNLYQEVSGEVTSTVMQRMEEEKKKIETTIENESIMEEKYNKGELDVDTYEKYRDSYHMCMKERDAFAMMYEHYLTVKEKKWDMVFDSYYNQLFRRDKTQAALILSILLISMLLTNCETRELEKILYVTYQGRKGIWCAKLKTVLLFSVVFAALYTFSEYGMMAYFSSFEQLEAPVQSIRCLEGVRYSLSIKEWMVLTIALRMVFAMLLGGVLLAMQSVIKNNKIHFVLILVLIVFPMVLDAGFGVERYNLISKIMTVYPLLG